MSGNAEPSNSRHMTVIKEEEARDGNKAFWSLSQEYEEAQANYEQDDPMEVEDASTTNGASSGDREDATTTDGANHTDGGTGGNQTAKKAKKGSDTASARQHRRHVWSRQVAYQCSRRFLPEGTTCN